MRRTISHRKFGNRLIFFLDELAREGTNRRMENDLRIPRPSRNSRHSIEERKGLEGTVRSALFVSPCQTSLMSAGARCSINDAPSACGKRRAMENTRSIWRVRDLLELS
ncbi:hypothetical protein ANTRET_LOCUS5994 [Anthophora retusa]